MLALGVPLGRLLRPPPAVAATAAAEAPKAAAEAPRPFKLQVEFTSPPRDFHVKHQRKEIWSEAAPATELDREFTLPLPKEGLELVFQATWPETSPSAARVRFTAPDGAKSVKYFWGQGPAVEVLTFP